MPGVALAAPTTRAGIEKPDYQDPRWDLDLNSNFDIIDASTAFQATVNTFTALNTFSGNVNLSSGVLLNGAAGSSGQVFTSGGSGSIPSWATPSAGGSSLAVATGTISGFAAPGSSPTRVINLSSANFTSTLTGGATAFVDLSEQLNIGSILFDGTIVDIGTGGGQFYQLVATSMQVTGATILNTVSASSVTVSSISLTPGGQLYINLYPDNILTGTSTIRLVGAAGGTSEDALIDYFGSPTSFDSRLRWTHTTNGLSNALKTQAGWNFQDDSGNVKTIIRNATNGRIVIYSTGTLQLWDGPTSNYVILRASTTILDDHEMVLPNTLATTNSFLRVKDVNATTDTEYLEFYDLFGATITRTGGTTHTSSSTFLGNVAISSGLIASGSAGTSGQFLKSNGDGAAPTWGTAAGGGASTLAIATGTISGFTVPGTSPTAVLNLDAAQFSSSLTGAATAFVTLLPSSVTLQGQNVIKLTQTLQSGATFFVSSGTVATLTLSSNTALNGDVNISSTVRLSGSAGTSGQVLTSGGAGAVPTWTTVSGGSGGGYELEPATVTINAAEGIVTTTLTVTATATINHLILSGTGAGEIDLAEGTAPSGIANEQVIYASSNTHWTHLIPNNGASYGLVGTSTSLKTSGNLAVWSTTYGLIDGGAPGSGGSDNLGSHIATKTVTANFGLVTTTITATVFNTTSSSMTITSTGGFRNIYGMNTGSLTVTNLTASRPVKTSSSGELETGQILLNNSNFVSGVLATSNLPTEIAYENEANTFTSSQTITSTAGVRVSYAVFAGSISVSTNSFIAGSTFTHKSDGGMLSTSRIVWADGTVQVSSPAAGGGSGDITDVIAGFGLTGGGVTGSVTLAAGTTTAFLTSSGTWTSSQTFRNIVTVSTNIVVSTNAFIAGATFYFNASSGTLAIGRIQWGDGTVQVSSPTGGGGTDTNADKEFVWPAGALLPLNADESIPPIAKSTGTNIDLMLVDFDQATDECRQAMFLTPPDMTSGGTVTFTAVWLSTSTSGDVAWDFRHNGGVAEGVNPDASLTVESATADATQGTGGQVTFTTWTETTTNLGWGASDFVVGTFCRDADAVGDTMAGDARALTFGIRIPRS